MKKIITTLLTIILSVPLLFVQASFAEDSATSAPKIAVVNWREAITSSAKGRAWIENNQKQLEKDSAELEKKRDELVKLEQDLRRDQVTLSDQEQETKQQEIAQKFQAFQEYGAQLEQASMEGEKKFMEEFAPIVDEAIAKMLEKKSYDIILDAATVVYSLPSYDITQEFIETINVITKNK